MSFCSTVNVSRRSQITRLASSLRASSTTFWISALSTSRTSLLNTSSKRPSYSTLHVPRWNDHPCSEARVEDGYNTWRFELEEPRAQNKGPRPGAVQGHLPPQVASSDDRDARLHGRGDRGSALGFHRRGGVPHYWSASLAPARALGRHRGILDARRGRKVPLQPLL